MIDLEIVEVLSKLRLVFVVWVKRRSLRHWRSALTPCRGL